jgi:thioredoxin reductase (NADPH)
MAALDAEWYLRDNPAVPTPAALENTGDLAEEQWAPVGQPTRSA